MTNVQRNTHQSSWKHPAHDHYLLLSAFWDIEALNRYLERSRNPSQLERPGETRTGAPRSASAFGSPSAISPDGRAVSGVSVAGIFRAIAGVPGRRIKPTRKNRVDR